jgi:hypothetical protein
MSSCKPGCRCDPCVSVASAHIQGILKAIGAFEQANADRIREKEMRRFNACPKIDG